MHLNRLNYLFITLALCCIGALPSLAQSPTKARKLNELNFQGSGYPLGYIHGSVLQLEISEIVSKWKANTSSQLGKDADVVIDSFFAYANFDEAIKTWTPELYDEVLGIAEGSGQAFNDILVLNLLDEFWVYLNDPTLHHCSAIGVPAINGRPTYVSQNMDIENYTDGYQTLIQLNPGRDGPNQMILTFPGLIVLNGMNDQGVGVCVNTLMQLKAASSGVPVAFVIRHILSLTDKEEILEFIQNVPHASGQNYIIGIKNEIYDFEASATKVIQYKPDNKTGVVSHTNHPLVNDDYKNWYLKDGELNLGAKPGKSNSELRLADLEMKMSSNNGVDDSAIMASLRSKDNKNHPVCRSYKEGNFGFTFASVIMTLSEQPYLEVTAGPPDESGYKRIDFSTR